MNENNAPLPVANANANPVVVAPAVAIDPDFVNFFTSADGMGLRITRALPFMKWSYWCPRNSFWCM